MGSSRHWRSLSQSLLQERLQGAMRFAYLLKKRTGLNISENCLARLSQEIKAVAVKPAQEQQKAEEPKKKGRKPRTKKAQVVALQ